MPEEPLSLLYPSKKISAGNMPECSSTSTTPPESEGERNKWVEHAASDSNVGFENFPGVKIKNCSNNRVNSGEFKPIHGSEAEKYEDAPKNKVVKWVRMLVLLKKKFQNFLLKNMA